MNDIKLSIINLIILISISFTAVAQGDATTSKLKGKVYDLSTGKIISGVKVVIPEIASAISNDSGYYELNKTIKGAYVQVIAPGYAPKRIYVKGQSILNIYLLDESFKGSYEDILLPFENSQSVDYAGTVSTYENRQAYQTGFNTLEQLMSGRFSGLNVIQRSGTPGAGANMFLNGLNTVNINSQPLIVVDGVIYENHPVYSRISGSHVSALSDIDVKDIENITVLKDGTSMYGSKASNGVILINTLRAKNSATRINFHTYTGINLEPSTKYKMMDAFDYKYYLSEMKASSGMSVNEMNALPYLNTVKPEVENWGVSGNADYYRYNQSTNWQDEVFRNSFNQNYYLNVTGGNEKTLVAVSVGYLKQNGDVNNTSYDKYSTRLNADIDMTSWFKLNANISFIFSKRSLAFESLSRNYNPIIVSLIKSPFTAPYVYNVAGERAGNYENVDVFGISNPAVLTNNSSFNDRFRFFGNLNGVITFSKYLTGDIIFGLTSDVVTKEQVFMPNYGVNHDLSASGAITNISEQLRNILGVINVDTRLNYNRTFQNSHHFSAHIGSRFQTGTNELDWGSAKNTSSDQMKTLGDGVNALAQVGGNLGSWKSVSNYINLNYSYQNKYLLMLNSSLDGSSRFGVEADGLKMFNHVFGFFPSINGAWVVSAEEFMRNFHSIDVLKLRAGYTVTGNDDIGNYAARSYFIPQGLLGAYGLISGTVPNPKLKWETMQRTNIGLDVSFLKERLNFSFDYYIAKTNDLVKQKKISSLTGFEYALVNDGSLSNNGFDFTVNSRLLDSRDFKVDLGVNVSSYANMLLSASTSEEFFIQNGGIVRSKTGHSVAQFYGYKTNGIFQTEADASTANLSIKGSDGSLTSFTAGDVRFVDMHEDGIIDSEDMTVIGDPNPELFGSVFTNIRWKQLSLNALFSYSYGNEVYNAVRANLESMSGFDNQTVSAIYRWKTEGITTSTPKIAYGDPMGNARFSDRWIEDGSYIRLRTLTLAYDFKVKSKIINSAQVYLTGNNLLTLSKYLGYDPEFSTSQSPLYAGIDNGVTPQQRTLLLGVKIGL